MFQHSYFEASVKENTVLYMFSNFCLASQTISNSKYMLIEKHQLSLKPMMQRRPETGPNGF